MATNSEGLQAVDCQQTHVTQTDKRSSTKRKWNSDDRPKKLETIDQIKICKREVCEVEDEEGLQAEETESTSHRNSEPHHDTSSKTAEFPQASFKYSWDEYTFEPTLNVICKNQRGVLHKAKFGSGSRGKCIEVNDDWYTPSEFEAFSGRGNSKDWKRSIKFGGLGLHALIDDGILMVHAPACTCASCCDDETMKGPVRLFMPYKRRKRGYDEGKTAVNNFLMAIATDKVNSSQPSVTDDNSSSCVPNASHVSEHRPLDLAELLDTGIELQVKSAVPFKVPSPTVLLSTGHHKTHETSHYKPAPSGAGTTAASGGMDAESIHEEMRQKLDKALHGTSSTTPTIGSTIQSSGLPNVFCSESGARVELDDLEYQMFSQLEEMASNLQNQIVQLKLQLIHAKQACLQSRVKQVNQLESRYQKERQEALQAVLIDNQLKLSQTLSQHQTQKDVAVQHAVNKIVRATSNPTILPSLNNPTPHTNPTSMTALTYIDGQMYVLDSSMLSSSCSKMNPVILLPTRQEQMSESSGLDGKLDL